MLGALPWITRVLALSTWAFVCYLIANSRTSGIPFGFVSFHGLAMTTAVAAVFPIGLVTYATTFSSRLEGQLPDRASRRWLHGMLMLTGTLLLVTGYLIAFTYAQQTGPAGIHVAIGQPVAVKVHVYAGLTTLVLAVLQTLVGLYKYVLKVRDGTKRFLFHGLFGPVVWLSGVVTVGSALYLRVWAATNSRAEASIAWTLLSLLAASVLAELFLGPRRARSARRYKAALSAGATNYLLAQTGGGDAQDPEAPSADYKTRLLQ